MRTEWIEPDVAAERGIIRVVEDAEPLPHEAITNSYTGKVLECAGCIYEHPKERCHSVHYGSSYWVIEVAEGYAPHLDYEKGVWACTAAPSDEPAAGEDMQQIQSGLYTMAGTAYETYAACGTDRTTWGGLSEEERQRWIAIVRRLSADKFGRAIQETEVDANGAETRETAVRRIAEWVISTRSHDEKAGAATRRLEDAIMQFLGAAL